MPVQTTFSCQVTSVPVWPIVPFLSSDVAQLMTVAYLCYGNVMEKRIVRMAPMSQMIAVSIV